MPSKAKAEQINTMPNKDFEGAKPKMQRPGTAINRKMPQAQAEMLAQMHSGPAPARPRTAATTTVFDEQRIKDKLKFLE